MVELSRPLDAKKRSRTTERKTSNSRTHRRLYGADDTTTRLQETTVRFSTRVNCCRPAENTVCALSASQKKPFERVALQTHLPIEKSPSFNEFACRTDCKSLSFVHAVGKGQLGRFKEKGTVIQIDWHVVIHAEHGIRDWKTEYYAFVKFHPLCKLSHTAAHRGSSSPFRFYPRPVLLSRYNFMQLELVDPTRSGDDSTSVSYYNPTRELTGSIKLRDAPCKGPAVGAVGLC